MFALISMKGDRKAAAVTQHAATCRQPVVARQARVAASPSAARQATADTQRAAAKL